MAHDIQVVIDSQDPHNLADWWADALGWQVERQDEAFIRLSRSCRATPPRPTPGSTRARWCGRRAPRSATRAGWSAPRACCSSSCRSGRRSRTGSTSTSAPGAGSIDAEVERLVGKGAKVLHEGRQGPTRWVTIIDPEGNELCIA
ncbi:VOC family protein [Nonomuraea ferruginea]